MCETKFVFIKYEIINHTSIVFLLQRMCNIFLYAYYTVNSVYMKILSIVAETAFL